MAVNVLIFFNVEVRIFTRSWNMKMAVSRFAELQVIKI